MCNSIARLKLHYKYIVQLALKEEFSYTNKMMIPRLDKIVLNMGFGDDGLKKTCSAITDMAAITGQEPIDTKAKSSIAGFRIRRGMRVGCKVTLRNNKMYEFLDRLTTVVMPRIRDFRGISSQSFDNYGNYCIGLKEHIVFPEINYDTLEKMRGVNIIFCTNAKTDFEAKAL